MPASDARGPIRVVAGVLRDAKGRVLVARRQPGKHLAGLWEFPGGKQHRGEAAPAALARELDEEIGVTLVASVPLVTIRHEYPGKTVRLDVHEVLDYRGTPRAREGQPLAWRRTSELAALPMPAADRPIVTALALPDRYLITPPCTPADGESLLAGIEAACSAGVRLVVLRQPAWPRAQIGALARKARAICRRHGARLLAHDDPALARRLALDGVHLSWRRAAVLGRRPRNLAGWFAVSCHDAAELAHAQRIGADFAVLSPLRRTPSHPGALPLGWRRARRLAHDAGLPVYFLGGLGPADVMKAQQHGARGIAAIRGLWPGG